MHASVHPHAHVSIRATFSERVKLRERLQRIPLAPCELQHAICNGVRSWSMQRRRCPLPPQPVAAAGDAEARVSGRRGAVGLCAAHDGARTAAQRTVYLRCGPILTAATAIAIHRPPRRCCAGWCGGYPIRHGTYPITARHSAQCCGGVAVSAALRVDGWDVRVGNAERCRARAGQAAPVPPQRGRAHACLSRAKPHCGHSRTTSAPGRAGAVCTVAHWRRLAGVT